MSHYLEYIFGEPSSSDEEEEEIYFEEGEEELELIEEGEEQDQPITDSILVQTQSEKKNKVKAKHNYQFKKENNGKGEVIIIPPTKEELEKEAKEREEQDLYDWDKIYNKLMNKKVNAIKFTMKDVECHKMNYDKLFYQLNNNQDDDYEEEDDDQEENHTEQGSSTSTVNLEDVEEKKKKKKKKKKNVNNVLKNQIDLGLKKMAGMSFGSYLVFYGGYKVGKGYYPQLVALDRKNNKWIDVKKRIDFMRDYLAKKLGNQNFYYNGNYVDVYYSPPPFVNYFAFNCGSYFVLFDGNNTCCYIRDFLDLLNLTEKTFLHQQKQQPTTEVKYYWKKITEIEHLNYGKTQFKQTINHSCSNIGSTVYVFGGRDVNTRRLVNQLTSCSINEGGVNNRYRNSSRTLVLQKKIINVSGAPCPRENHAQCCVGDCIYIYGGNFNNENQLLNDLHCFNIKYNMWTQIELNLLAPPLRNHTFSNGLAQYLYLIGGYLSNGEVNDVLYRFNIKENSVSI